MAYVTLEEVRNEGLTSAQASDARVLELIEYWSRFIDQACGQWFESRSLTVEMDGNDSPTLFLLAPIIELSALYLNEDTAPLPVGYYRVYNSRALPDDRRNPRIKLKGFKRDIFRPGLLSADGPRFLKGERNQKLVGTFGFTEADGSTPPLIKRAVLRLVLKNPRPMGEGGGGPPVTQFIKSETTDGHSISYATPSELGVGSTGTLGVTGDPETERIIRMYRRPILLGAPGAMHYTEM